MTLGKFYEKVEFLVQSVCSLSKIIFIPIASGPPSDFLESGPTESLIQMMRTITELKELKMFTMKKSKKHSVIPVLYLREKLVVI